MKPTGSTSLMTKEEKEARKARKLEKQLGQKRKLEKTPKDSREGLTFICSTKLECFELKLIPYSKYEKKKRKEERIKQEPSERYFESSLRKIAKLH